MTVTINGTSGITSPGLNSTGSNVLGDNVADTLNVGNGAIVTDSSGNVGIGTSSVNANARMQINGRTYMGSNDSVYAAGLFYNNTRASAGQGYYLGATDSTAPSLVFSNNDGTERMRIDSSGNLLVGTTSASGVVTINRTSSATGTQLHVTYGVGDSYGAVFKTTTTNGEAIQFRNSSNTAVGLISTTASATTYATSSDYRLKENVQPMQNALATVAQLNPVTYNWKADGSDGQGFIAHELQAVVPDCVTGEKDDVDEEGNPVYQGIDTSFLVATLTKAIQELSAKNDALEARLAVLEAK